MKLRATIIIVLLAIIVALPVLLRRETSTVSPQAADDRLVIISPHIESIRHEFGEAFARYWKTSTGRTLYVDWRTPGGTSEIRMVLDAGYEAAEDTGRDGIGIDIFFGGGAPDFSGQAKKGRFVPLQVFTEHPDWFGEAGQIPETFTGERYYAADHTWVSTCMSQFGICYNPDVLERLHLPAPKIWDDLGDPGYTGSLALADPTKSGSVARTFELLIQDQIQRELKKPGIDRQTALDTGWKNGLQLIQRMAANSRYFTDSASKPPLDVGQGNAAAGMCIDFYGRSFSEALTTRDGSPRLIWIAPKGGTTLSGDPVAVLKGAPHPEIAQAFVTFCLTPEAQKLWFARPGTPGGTETRALHRAPIRKDVYTAENLANSTMPNAHPYTDEGNFIYQGDLTGSAFNTIRQLVKIMCIDSHEEMTSAWKAIIDAGMPPDAVAAFSDVSITPYESYGKGNPELDTKDSLKAAEFASKLGAQFRANYRRAEEIARKSATASHATAQ
ncbi:extracellular solute-binding protein [Luteolibacter pohnpeiensis]|uniref:Extracellular solute-binding protein n=1 Tax=Luteolibacter pohnpeiensis TaxID=454153 RepID=A0A934VY40_9BACT|nr:extracellular solute-binding protein [Luteolibacter pohnpeiensis]MBK1884149.1 extracellular solute-binding protein [Luteolibacter pohnpeiensis]